MAQSSFSAFGKAFYDVFSRLSNAADKKFEFDLIASQQHNPLTFVSCSPPFDAEKRQVFRHDAVPIPQRS